MLTRPRRNGWTPEVQQLFLDELTCTASPKLAAAAAGRSLQSAYKLRERASAISFREGWAAAMADCLTRVRETAIDHAFNGHTAPIMKYGRKIGERHVINDRMLLSLMRLYDAPAYHADRAREIPPVAAATTKPLTQADAVAQCKAALAQLLTADFPQAAVIVQDV